MILCVPKTLSELRKLHESAALRKGHEFPQLSTDVISLWVLRPSFAV